MRAANLLACAILAGGCLGRVVHLPRNAPGRAALESAPPAELPIGEAVPPEDPGERLLAVVPELTATASYRQGAWAAVGTGQIALLYGDRVRSHLADDLPFGDTRVAPNRAIGGAVGIDLWSSDEGARRVTLAARLADTIGGIEAGYGFAPGPTVHSIFLGAYLSGWSRFFSVRVWHAFESDFGVDVGLTLDYAFTWIWSK